MAKDLREGIVEKDPHPGAKSLLGTRCYSLEVLAGETRPECRGTVTATGALPDASALREGVFPKGPEREVWPPIQPRRSRDRTLAPWMP